MSQNFTVIVLKKGEISQGPLNLVSENLCVTRDHCTKKIFFFLILCITVSRLVPLPNSYFEGHVTIILGV